MIFYLFLTNLAVCVITVNIMAFISLFTDFRQANIPYSNWFISTSVIPIVLFFIAILLYTIPLLQRNKSGDDKEIHPAKDFKKIVNELYLPTTFGYKINLIIRLPSILLGFLIFLANLVLSFVGIFLFMVP